ncbi:MAG TPA: DUF4238 domain-containing protein [Thermoanaerobaculia bacterium]
MRRKPLKSDAKRHHLIPESYMRRFAFDGRRVYVFDRVAGKLRPDVPKNVAVESEFNSILKTSGEKDRGVEAALAELDGLASQTLDKLERGESLTREERWYVSFFIGFAETRGRGFRDAVVTDMPDSIDYAKPERGFVDDQFARAFSAASGVILDPWTIESLVIDATRDVASGAYEVGRMIKRAFEVARHAFWSEWCVVQADETEEFITSDRPLGILVKGEWFGDDPREPFAIKVLPLSRRRAVIFRASRDDRALTYETLSGETVRMVNAAITYRYDRNLIAASPKLIERALSDCLVLQCHHLGLSTQAVLRTA